MTKEKWICSNFAGRLWVKIECFLHLIIPQSAQKGPLVNPVMRYFLRSWLWTEENIYEFLRESHGFSLLQFLCEWISLSDTEDKVQIEHFRFKTAQSIHFAPCGTKPTLPSLEEDATPNPYIFLTTSSLATDMVSVPSATVIVKEILLIMKSNEQTFKYLLWAVTLLLLSSESV